MHIIVSEVHLARGEQEVVLIGMTHVAPVEFYRKVTRILEDYGRAGFAILYEDIDGVDNTLSSLLGDAFESIKDAKRAMVQVLHQHGWEYQAEAIPVRPEWVYSDDISALISTLKAEAHNERGWERILKERQARYAPFLENPEAIMASLVPVLENRVSPIMTRSRYYEAGMEFRNDHLVREIDSLSRTRPVVAWWGSSHIPGVFAGLKALGFKSSQTE